MRMLGLWVVSALSCLLSGALAHAQANAPDAPAPPAATPPAASFPEATPVQPSAPVVPLPPSTPLAAQPQPLANPDPNANAHGVKVVGTNPFAPALSSTPANTPAPVDDGTEQHKDFTPFKLAFGLEGGLGANGRIDGGPSNFAQKDRFDIALSLGAWAEPNRTWAYGLEYARTGLGGARSLPTAESVTVAYDLNTLWAKARYFALRETKYRGYAGLGLGLSLEEVRANGTHQSSMPFNVPPQVFACSAVSHPTVSLGAAAGMDVDLEQHLAFLFQVEAAAQPITGDVVGECAVASGSVLNAVARLGFAYKFDASDSFMDQPKSHVARR